MCIRDSHYANDVMRVQQIRNIGMVEGNSPVSPNEWEQVKRSGDSAIEKWIDDNMKYRSCVVVLIGEETASRPWVKYEIRKAWSDAVSYTHLDVYKRQRQNWRKRVQDWQNWTHC